MERLLRSHVDLDAEQLLKILHEPGMVEQAPARLPDDQKVEVAALRCLPAGNRAKHTDVPSAALSGQMRHLVAEIGAQCSQRQHVSILLQFPAIAMGAGAEHQIEARLASYERELRLTSRPLMPEQSPKLTEGSVNQYIAQAPDGLPIELR